MSTKANDESADDERAEVTPEVGDEGGTPGDIEIDRDQRPATGSEAGEVWRPSDADADTIVRDEKGQGRRSP